MKEETKKEYMERIKEEINKKCLIENYNINLCINELIKNNYKYILKARDEFLSGWGLSKNKKHIQLMAFKTWDELEKVKERLKKDNSYKYIDWNYLSNKQAINNYIRNKSYTIRNDFK